MADHPGSHNPSVNQRITQLKKQRKKTGGEAPAIAPADRLRQLKDSSHKKPKRTKKR